MTKKISSSSTKNIKKIFTFKDTIKNIKLSWKYAKSQKGRLIIYMITTLFLSIISAITPMLSAQIVLQINGSFWKTLFWIAATIFVIEVLRNIIWSFTNKLSQLFFRNTLIEIQTDLAKETLKLETKEIDNNSSGVFIDRLNRDSNDIASVFGKITYSLTDIITNIGVLFAIFIINKWIFLFFVIALTVIFILNKCRMAHYFKLDENSRKISEKNTGLITELIRGIRDIKVLNSDSTFMNLVRKRLVLSNEERYKMNSVNRKYNLITGSIIDSFNFLFIIIGIILIQYNQLNAAIFVILYMYQAQVYNLLKYAARLIEEIKNFNLSASRVFEVIENNKFEKENFGTIELPIARGDFSFQNVTFGYNKDAPIIKNMSFDIRANETVAFVGKSGAGKTTIFSLLTKLYTIDSGNITIDGLNINDLTKSAIRDNISIITQTPYIFNFTIKENLKIVKEDLTDEEMIYACKQACLHDYIMSLPDGYDTMVGEGGLTLSGGQRQRLAIARAFLKKTEIILLDEATSALDNETQRNIQNAINNLKKDYTILIIAHRLSTVIDSNRIMLIDDGQVVAEGTHQELLQNNTVYKELYETELLETAIQ